MNKYPWLVRIWTVADEESHCGGTLVATKYVVTACHCLYEYSKQAVIINGNDVYLITREYTPAELKVTIGDYKLDTINETGKERHIKVKSIRKHSKWHQSIPGQSAAQTNGYDIAILELEEEVDLTEHTPACLAKLTEGTRYNGERAVAAGWGLTENPKPYPPATAPNEPYEVELKVALSTAADCKDPTGRLAWHEDPSILCALSPDNVERSTCTVSIRSYIYKNIYINEICLKHIILSIVCESSCHHVSIVSVSLCYHQFSTLTLTE